MTGVMKADTSSSDYSSHGVTLFLFARPLWCKCSLSAGVTWIKFSGSRTMPYNL